MTPDELNELKSRLSIKEISPDQILPLLVEMVGTKYDLIDDADPNAWSASKTDSVLRARPEDILHHSFISRHLWIPDQCTPFRSGYDWENGPRDWRSILDYINANSRSGLELKPETEAVLVGGLWGDFGLWSIHSGECRSILEVAGHAMEHGLILFFPSVHLMVHVDYDGVCSYCTTHQLHDE